MKGIKKGKRKKVNGRGLFIGGALPNEERIESPGN